MLLGLFLSTGAVVVHAASALSGNRGPFTATTSHGQYIGHPSPDNPAVGEFLGIPYAQPPLAQLRFAAPQARRKGDIHSPFYADHYAGLFPIMMMVFV